MDDYSLLFVISYQVRFCRGGVIHSSFCKMLGKKQYPAAFLVRYETVVQSLDIGLYVIRQAVVPAGVDQKDAVRFNLLRPMLEPAATAGQEYDDKCGRR